MTYRIEQLTQTRGSFDPYKYHIFKNNKLIAEYWHDFCGDEHGIKFKNGFNQGYPVGKVIDFLNGGGSSPITLSPKAIDFLQVHTN